MFDSGWEDRVTSDLTVRDISTGMIAGTKVATPNGWRGVEAIAPGDRVLTFDGGMQPVLDVQCHIVHLTPGTATHLWPMHVPAGALGNRTDMWLLAEQSVLVESDTAEEVFGDPFALIPAMALEGVRGIDRVAPPARFEVIVLRFAEDEIVFANVGALFHCPKGGTILDAALDDAGPRYAVLPLDKAALLVEFLEIEDRGRVSATPATKAFCAVA